MPERLITLRELNQEALTHHILLDQEALSGSEDPNDLVLRYLVASSNSYASAGPMPLRSRYGSPGGEGQQGCSTC